LVRKQRVFDECEGVRGYLAAMRKSLVACIAVFICFM
jgi:hypothetical protein